MSSFTICNILRLCVLLFGIQFTNALRYGTAAPPDAEATRYTVALLSSHDSGDGFHKCAGVLVSPRTVLTTARCVQNETASTLKVRVGSYDRTSGGAIIGLTAIRPHPNFDPISWDYDIAVLTLTESAVRDYLPSAPAAIGDYSLHAQDTAALYGWGLYNYSDTEFPKKLQTLDQAIFVRNDLCADIWHYIHNITERMICDYPGREKASWDGDRGGPLVSEQTGHVLGLISFSIYDTDKKQVVPEVSTNLESYKDWLQDKLMS